jgi:predicted transposase YbfD/YdcC
VPACLSNLTLPTIDQPADPRVCPDVTDGEVAGVADAVADVADPRKPRGRRHGGFGLLMGVLVAVLAGARTTVQIAEHVQDLTDSQRARIGLTWKSAPSLSTIRRFLMSLDAQVLQTALTAWATAHAARVAAAHDGLRHFAVDGKSLRGAARKGCRKPHLLGVLDVTTAVFLTQREIGAKTNEIGLFTQVMDQIGSLDGVLVSGDAMHCQTGHATYLHERGAGLLVGLKANQPTALAQVETLPWDQIRIADVEVTGRLHGRVEKRVVQVTAIGRHDDKFTFPLARQVARITRYEQRRTRTPGRWYWKKIEVAYYLCTWDQARLPAARLARAVKDHWLVEVWHWLRDVTFGEDDHLARSGNIAVNLAAVRNTVISLLHLAGTHQIARTLRRLARNPEHAITLLTSPNPTLN